jgi:hypothetical protein
VTKKSFKFASQHELPFFFVSAADGANVVQVSTYLTFTYICCVHIEAATHTTACLCKQSQFCLYSMDRASLYVEGLSYRSISVYDKAILFVNVKHKLSELAYAAAG